MAREREGEGKRRDIHSYFLSPQNMFGFDHRFEPALESVMRIESVSGGM